MLFLSLSHPVVNDIFPMSCNSDGTSSQSVALGPTSRRAVVQSNCSDLRSMYLWPFSFEKEKLLLHHRFTWRLKINSDGAWLHIFTMYLTSRWHNGSEFWCDSVTDINLSDMHKAIWCILLLPLFYLMSSGTESGRMWACVYYYIIANDNNNSNCRSECRSFQQEFECNVTQ